MLADRRGIAEGNERALLLAVNAEEERRFLPFCTAISTAGLRTSSLVRTTAQIWLRHTRPAANTFCTSVREMPNCRAICAGFIPALKAARTALIFEGVKARPTKSACRLPGAGLPGFLPRRFCSASAAASSRSSSSSLSCFRALGKSLGNTCRTTDDDAQTGSCADWAENKSGKFGRALRLVIG